MLPPLIPAPPADLLKRLLLFLTTPLELPPRVFSPSVKGLSVKRTRRTKLETNEAELTSFGGGDDDAAG